MAYHNLGNDLLELKRLDEASAAYQKAYVLHRDPSYATGFNNLGIALADRNRPEEAIAKFQMAIELDPKSFLAYGNLSTLFCKLKRLDEAIAVCHQAIKIEGNNARAYSSLGTVLAHKKRFEEAVRAYQKAIQLDAKFASAYSSLGNVLCELKRLDEAVLACQKAIEIDPGDAQAHSNLGAAYADQMRLDEAIAAYQKAIQIDPNYGMARYNLGNAFWKLKRLDEAIAAYRKAIELDPDYAKSYCNLGAAFYGQHRLDEAIAQFQKAIQKDPELALAYANLGAALLDKKRVDEAVAVLEKAVQIDRNNAEAYTNLGAALHAQKRLDKAIAAFQQAIRLAPKLANPRLGLANPLFQKGLFGEAAQTLQQARDLLPPGDPLRSAAERALDRAQKMLALKERLSLVLDGKEKAQGPELIELAHMCSRYLQRYPTAVRLYRQAFQTDKGGANWARRNRFHATCAAALASTGQGDEAGKLKDAEKAEFRAQARAWLQADLDLYARQLKEAQPTVVLQLFQELTRRLEDPDLARLHKGAGLAPDEQKTWQQIWADARRLLQKVEARFTETRFEGALTATETLQVHKFKMTAGKTYLIDLESIAFDTYLILQDPHGKVLAENDDISPDNPNSRLLVMAKQSGVYRLVATSFQQRGVGAYTLRIREFAGPASSKNRGSPDQPATACYPARATGWSWQAFYASLCNYPSVSSRAAKIFGAPKIRCFQLSVSSYCGCGSAAL